NTASDASVFAELGQGRVAADGDRVGRGVGATVRDRQQDLRNAHLERLVARGAAEVDPGLAVGVVAHLQVGPAHAAPPARPQTLEDRFLGRPAPRKVLGGVLAALTVADLPPGVDARQEQLAVLLDHAPDAQTFHDVGADSNDFHDPTVPATSSSLLLILAEPA